MTHDDARNLCAAFGIARHPLPDWHAMDSDQKERILAAADNWKYRKPRNAKPFDNRTDATRAMHCYRYPDAFWDCELRHRANIDRKFAQWIFKVVEL